MNPVALSCLVWLALCLLARVGHAATRVNLGNTFEVLVHQQSAAIIDPFGALQPVGTLSVWKDGKPSDFCEVVPANLTRTILG